MHLALKNQREPETSRKCLVLTLITVRINVKCKCTQFSIATTWLYDITCYAMFRGSGM